MTLSKADWESLCKRCGKCCYLIVDNGDWIERSTTKHCPHYDPNHKHCTVYPDRFRKNPNCRELLEICLPSYENGFLPEDCGYREYYRRVKNETKVM
jgi:uncharacterized cysteine cluster protein YcgN (CxxCxxCC family)